MPDRGRSEPEPAALAPAFRPLTQPLLVRYHECDQQGLVFNAHYLTWFDMNMTELWRAAFGGYLDVVERGYDIVVAEAQLRFLAPARFDERLTLEVAVTHLGTTSVVTEHAALRDGERLVEGRLRHVVVDARTWTKAAMPDWFRAGLAPWSAPGPG